MHGCCCVMHTWGRVMVLRDNVLHLDKSWCNSYTTTGLTQAFPDPIALSPGCAFLMALRFRPAPLTYAFPAISSGFARLLGCLICLLLLLLCPDLSACKSEPWW